MIVEIPLSESGSAFAGPSPSNLAPLFEAAKRGAPLEPPVQDVLTSLGFSSFLFGMTLSPARSNDGRFYYSSNALRSGQSNTTSRATSKSIRASPIVGRY